MGGGRSHSTLWRREGMKTLCTKKRTSAALAAYSASLLARACTLERPSCTAARFTSMPTARPILPTCGRQLKGHAQWMVLKKQITIQ